MIKDTNKKIEESLFILNDNDLNNSSFVNMEYLEYAIDKKLYGIIDSIFYLVKVEYIFEVNKNYELLLPVMKRYYQENNIDLNLNTAKIYNTLEEYLSLEELNIFVKNSSIEQTLNSRISLVSESETDLLYKNQYIETLSDYVKKINPFETNKTIKDNKKKLIKRNIILNISFIIVLLSFLTILMTFYIPDTVFANIKLPNDNLMFMYKSMMLNTSTLILVLSSIWVFLFTSRSNIVRSGIAICLLFFSFSLLDNIRFESSKVFAKPQKEVLTFDKVSIYENFKSKTDLTVKRGEIKNNQGFTIKEYVWPENIKIKKGVKYEVEHYNNLIVNIKEQK